MKPRKSMNLDQPTKKHDYGKSEKGTNADQVIKSVNAYQVSMLNKL